MSYLSALRFHFSGSFVADVPTMDNWPDNHEAASKGEEIQRKGFNPNGSGAFRLAGCVVQSAFYADGARVGDDSIIGMKITDAGGLPAKMVDLDVDQQDIPMIFGLRIWLEDQAGQSVLRGEFKPAAAADIWTRCPQKPGSVDGQGASYQSVITGLQWADLAVNEQQQTLGGSRFLFQLQRRTPEGGSLSIKINLDAFRLENRGRIVGTIGPVGEDEPDHFVRGRHFFARPEKPGEAAATLHHGVAVLDSTLGRIRVDLGNALPTETNGKLLDVGPMHLECVEVDTSEQFVQRIVLGEIEYLDPDWYGKFAGIAEFAIPRPIYSLVANNPIGITLPDASGWPALALRETPKGLHIQSENPCCRLAPGDEAVVELFATQYGVPRRDARVILFHDTNEFVAGSDGGLSFPSSVITDDEGWAEFRLQGGFGAIRRKYIDSKLYRIRYALEETMALSLQYPFNASDTVSVVVWEDFKPEALPVTWYGTVLPILRKYAGLFPVMKLFVDLTDYDAVCAKAQPLLHVLSLQDSDPQHMPVSRDLSPAKRKAIVEWLQNPGPDGKPLRGIAP